MDLKEGVEAIEKLRAITADDGVLSFALIALVLFLLTTSLVKLAELVVKAIGAIANAAKVTIDIFRGGVAYREHIQRRRQFISVLSSDLATIGKAEAWNDQNFTDLEAEVQIDGGHFASVFDRLRNHRSYGQRREKSLIGAIDGSTERCLLLTGDPGAGKSVALRHLAMQMLERARKSRRMYVPIPLYVNLRELVQNGDAGPASIRDFVVDNIRRGDADTADYVNRNWQVFNEKGGWFFLFDSFDEIPEVLHAANEDAKVEKYGRAIQQFMDGLGECRGVLASREYKSPRALAWPRLKILPLSESLQEELVGNTFLSREQKLLSMRVLSTSHTATYRNPLFLTLLCRYVREHDVGPRNEHQLLYSHIKSLCDRDEDYVMRRWGLSSTALMEGAVELAMVFATSPELGLAPTVEEIALALRRDSSLVGKSEAIIEALTYVKVGRMDVASAVRRERRFAFSHRRYHEAIFAKHLSENLHVIEPSQLLRNPRWREYVVAMLQMEAADGGHPVVAAAATVLSKEIAKIKLHDGRVSGFALRIYGWQDDVILHLLKLMVDVKRFNPSSLWGEAERVVEEFFSPLWSRGDLFDRLMIIRYGGAGDSTAHSRRIEYARRSGIPPLQEEAVASCQFASSPTPEVASWIRKWVVRSIVTSSRKLDALKWEALAAQLPVSYETDVCVERSKNLRSQYRFVRWVTLPFQFVDRTLESIFKIEPSDSRSYGNFKFSIISVSLIPALAVFLTLFSPSVRGLSGYPKGALAGLALVLSISFVVNYARLHNIALPRRMGLSDIISSFKVDYKMLLLAPIGAALLVITLSLPGLVVLWISRSAGFFSGYQSSEIIFSGSIAVFLLFMAVVALFSRWHDHRSGLRARAFLDSRKSLRSAVVGGSGFNVAELCYIAVMEKSVSESDARRTISLISERILRRGAGSGSRSELPTSNSEQVAAVSMMLVDMIRRRDAVGTGG